jgi:hypothetical protein
MDSISLGSKLQTPFAARSAKPLNAPEFAGDLQRDLLTPTEEHPDHNPRAPEM